MKDQLVNADYRTFKRRSQLKGKKRGRPKKSKISREQHLKSSWLERFKWCLEFVIENDNTEFPDYVVENKAYKLGVLHAERLAIDAFQWFVWETLRVGVSVSKEAIPYLKMAASSDEKLAAWARKVLKEEFPNDIVRQITRKIKPREVTKKECIGFQRMIDEYNGILTFPKASKLLGLTGGQLETLIAECHRQKVRIKTGIDRGEKILVAR